MPTKPLSEEAQAKLEELKKKRKLLSFSKKHNIDRRTLSEALAGYPKREATRFLIEEKLKEEQV